MHNLEEAFKQRDLITLYDVYREEDLSKDDLDAISSLVIEIAQEDLHEAIVSHTKMDYANKREQFVLRVLYELALADFEASELHNAGEQFAILSVVSNEAHFSNAMQKHLCATKSGSYEEFVKAWVAEAPTRFYLSKFTKRADDVCKNMQTVLKTYLQPYKKLF